MNPTVALHRRPIAVASLFLCCICLGGIMLPQLRMDRHPEGLTAHVVFVSARLEGAGSRETLESVTRPAERILASVPGIEGLTTRSHGERFRAYVGPAEGEDVEALAGRIHEALLARRHEFPAEMDDPRVRTWSVDDEPTITVGFGAGELPWPTFRHRVIDELVPALRRIEGVAEVSVPWSYEGDVLVALDRDRVAAGRVRPRSIGEQIGAARPSSFTWPVAGADGVEDRILRLENPHADRHRLGELPVATNRRLAEVAAVVDTTTDDDAQLHIDGRAGIFVDVYRSPNANGYRVSGRVADRVAELAPELGLTWVVANASHEDLDDAFLEILSSALWGGAFAVLFLYAFLRRIRLTLLIAASLPLSIAFAILAFATLGESLNVFVMVGFLLAMGMLVDNSIVVGEALTRAAPARDPEARIRNLARAVGSVAGAIVLSTLTTLAILLPIHLIEGTGFLKAAIVELGKPIVWSLLASLVVALVLVPLAYPRLSRGALAPRPKPRWLRGVERLYGAVLAGILRRPWLGLLVGVAVLAAMGALLTSSLPTSRGAEQEERRVQFGIEPRAPDDLDAMVAQVQAWHRALEPHYGELAIKATSSLIGTERGHFNCYLEAVDPRGRTVDEIAEEAADHFEPSLVATIDRHHHRARVDPPDGERDREPSRRRRHRRGGGDHRDGTALRLRLFHPNPEVLKLAWSQLRPVLAAMQGVLHPGSEELRESPTLELALRAEAAGRGYDARSVARQTARYASTRRIGDLPDATRVRMGPLRRRTPDLTDLRATPIWNQDGSRTPLADLADVGAASRPRVIRRRNGKSEHSIRMWVGKDAYNAIVEKVEDPAWIASVGLPSGTSIGLGWREQRSREQMTMLLTSLVLAILIVYLLMGVFYESVVAPFAVIVAVPLAAASVFAWLGLSGQELDPIVVIGLLLLTGIVVNNGIVLVDRLRSTVPPGRIRFRHRHALALAAASRRRFAPVLLTSLTTICGALPMALGAGRVGGFATAKLGATVAIGLAGATFFTLFMVPLAYQWFARFRVVVVLVVGGVIPLGGAMLWWFAR